MPIRIHLGNKSKLTKIAVIAGSVALLAAPLAPGAKALLPSTSAHASSILPGKLASAKASENDAYDISQWQGYITPAQAEQLKREVGFVILRAQNGGLETDSQFAHNARLMKEYHIPYGVYSYSLYANSAQARQEAEALHRRAPNAKFYVNDCETNLAGYGLDRATDAWTKEMHRLTNRPDILYSGLYFMTNNFSQQTRNDYNGIWVAAYGASEPDPAYHYDLWQFADNHYSRALGRALDDSTFPYGGKPLSFWIGGGGNTRKSNLNPKKPQRSSIQPLNKAARNAVNKAGQAAQAKDKKSKRKARNYKKQAQAAARQNASLQQQLEKTQNENKLESEAMNAKDNQIKSLQGQLAKDQKEINQLQHEKLNVGPVSAKNKPTKQAMKKAAKKNVKVVNNKFGPVNSNYYHSKNVHYLEVTNPWGIMLYNNKGQKIGRVYQGTVLKVNGFIKERYHGMTITKAVGIHWGKTDYFTTNKNFVHWYRG